MQILLTSIAVMAAVSAVLSVLLVLADRYLNSYGPCKININDGTQVLEVQGGESLLGSLGANKIFIPSACGGRGSCGLCKLTIKSGGGPVLPTEEPHLTLAEIKENVRLSCQVKVREDMVIEIPDELFSVKEFEGTVENLEELTYDIKLVRIRLNDPETVDIVPGQYMQLECPPYKMSAEAVYRAYSIATDPEDKRHVDLLIRLVPDGICTTWVFEHLKEGDKVRMNGPYGDFRLHDGEGEMIFIAGGSGMAPFRSMLTHMAQTQNPRKTRFFFGAQTRKDLFYVEDMKEFESKLPDFKFIPALSNAAEDDQWDGETGLITDVVAAHYEDCSDKQAYLCGSPGMCNACVKVLGDKGLTEDNVYFDKFA
ncbi:MAG: 2Fe-2S iron-sulfur cluster binding domain-containing protein [Lentisphaeria bacterium]|nr:2Fe-2S iron-sulfur cluster binding domain-containing protein [Lentisphaeria bacterium]